MSDGVGTVRHLLRRTERVRMVVVIEKCASKLSIPISGLGTLKFCWVWDMACGKGCSRGVVPSMPKTTLSCLDHPLNVSLTL